MTDTTPVPSRTAVKQMIANRGLDHGDGADEEMVLALLAEVERLTKDNGCSFWIHECSVLRATAAEQGAALAELENEVRELSDCTVQQAGFYQARCSDIASRLAALASAKQTP